MSVTEPAVDRTPSAAPGRPLRRAAVAASGGAIVLLGLALLPLPGPGTLVILGGLAVLRREFPVAGKAADGIKVAARKAMSMTTRKT